MEINFSIARYGVHCPFSEKRLVVCPHNERYDALQRIGILFEVPKVKPELSETKVDHFSYGASDRKKWGLVGE